MSTSIKLQNVSLDHNFQIQVNQEKNHRILNTRQIVLVGSFIYFVNIAIDVVIIYCDANK